MWHVFCYDFKLLIASCLTWAFWATSRTSWNFSDTVKSSFGGSWKTRQSCGYQLHTAWTLDIKAATGDESLIITPLQCFNVCVAIKLVQGEKMSVRLVAHRPVSCRTFQCLNHEEDKHLLRCLSKERFLTSGSETSGTMLHWILQPLRTEFHVNLHIKLFYANNKTTSTLFKWDNEQYMG